MNVSVILGHPSKESFNHSIANAVVAALREKNHQIIFHDLYAEHFESVFIAAEIPKNALLDVAVQQRCDEIAAAERIIIIPPNWRGQPPAIMNGWIDRVIRPGIAYEFVEEDSGEDVLTIRANLHCAFASFFSAVRYALTES